MLLLIKWHNIIVVFRTGRKLDIQDPRSSSFAHLLSIFPECKFKYLLLENVKGFETSEARDFLLSTLKKCEMTWQEFLLSPTDINVPNSRLRYYLIAKKVNLEWCFERTEELMSGVPFWDSKYSSPYASVAADHDSAWDKYRPKSNVPVTEADEAESHVWCVGDILEQSDALKTHLIPTKLVNKYGIAMDIVTAESTKTNCFTKGYGTYIKGTGSYIAQEKEVHEDLLGMESSGISISDKLVNMKLRYFSPKEVARLLCFPDDFTFPPALSIKQCYRSLGNSINVYVVAILLSLLLTESRD